jgi:hypothetical protein
MVVPALAVEPARNHPVSSASVAAFPDSPGSTIAANGEWSSSAGDPGELPDTTPGVVGFDPQATGQSHANVLLPRVKFVSAGQIAPQQRTHDKIVLGLRESVTPFSMIGWVSSAGWSHLINSSPNYGVNSEAFAQRLGAAAASGASKEIFSDSFFAPIFHQDPRYYQLGHGHTFMHRAFYAATRSVVGRTDNGRTIVNYAGILGTGGSAALTQAYYPDRNLGASQVMQSWATGIGGSSLGYLISEFGGEIIQVLHVKKHE